MYCGDPLANISKPEAMSKVMAVSRHGHMIVVVDVQECSCCKYSPVVANVLVVLSELLLVGRILLLFFFDEQ
jgi:hypothetical protein